MLNKTYLLLVIITILGTSCATIFGGREYNAHIKSNRPNANIYVNNKYIGKGYGKIQIPRKDANQVSILLKEVGCLDTQFYFTSRKLRPLPLANGIAGGLVGTFFNPLSTSYLFIYSGQAFVTFYPLYIWGASAYVDLINFGTMYKPDVNEKGIYKMDYDNYRYNLTSTCITDQATNVNTSIIKGAVYLKNGNIIRGDILEIIPYISIKIRTSDGSVFNYKYDDIEKYTPY